jgi:hypothetical protein
MLRSFAQICQSAAAPSAIDAASGTPCCKAAPPTARRGTGCAQFFPKTQLERGEGKPVTVALQDAFTNDIVAAVRPSMG